MNTIGNIGVYHPLVFCVRSGFSRYLFTALHVEVKGGIVSIQLKLIELINKNQRME